MRYRSAPSRALLTPLVLLALAPAARADMLFFKDGFVLQGKVRRDSTVYVDPATKEPVIIPKGFYALDDGPRRFLFSPVQIRIVEKTAPPSYEYFLNKNKHYILGARGLPPLLDVLEAPDFDAKWQRPFVFRSTIAARVGLRQQVHVINSQWMKVDAITKFGWQAFYLTSEFEPAKIVALLDSYPDLQETPKLSPAEVVNRRMRRCDFYAQAGWFDRAAKELDRLLKDFPDQKDRVANARKALDKLSTQERFEQIKRWHAAGRHKMARKAILGFPTRGIAPKILTDLRTLKGEYARKADLLEQCTRHLGDLAKEVTEPRHKPLAKAAAVIADELHPDTVERLDAFLGQARQYRRQRAAGRKPDSTPAALLSLAVSGWLLGSPSAEARPEAALALWRTRALVLDYVRADDRADREKMLRDYLKDLPTRVEVDEVAQLIPHLPPAIPAKDLRPVPVEYTAGRGRNAIPYLVQVPPEYTHNRPYPVLIVLHREGERPADVLRRWAGGAAENGYVLAAPEWEQGLGGGYGYTEREHDAVTETLRDLRRRFRVDSDRVFLSGLGEGAKMAFDVGLAHPGLFAGVLPVSGGPYLFASRYWRNAQYLPFYVVVGDRSGEDAKRVTAQFNNWVMRGFPALWVGYKGRGLEWFPGEVPSMFDWMRHQRRAFPLRQLGTDGGGGNFGNEFTTMRPEDNSFYWLSTSDVSPRCCTTARRWSNLVDPAHVTARIDPDTNTITAQTFGLRQLTVWLGRNARGEYLIDFEKPVTVRVGFRAVVYNKRISPSLEVLLEDLHARGDRQNLYLAKVDVRIR